MSLRDLVHTTIIGLMAVVSVASTAAAKPAATPCSGGTFVVQARLLAPEGTALVERIVLGATDAVVSSGCTTPGTLTLQTRKRTTVTVAWPSCTGLTGAVALKAKFSPTCDVLKGKLIAKQSKPKKRKFTATRLTVVEAPDALAFGSSGGTFTNAVDGTEVTVPPGAYGEDESGKVSVAAVPVTELDAALSAYGLTLPEGFSPIGAAQVVLDGVDPKPGAALTVSLPEPAGISPDDALLHVLVEPGLVAGSADSRTPQLVFDGEAVRANGRLALELSTQNLGAPTVAPAAIAPELTYVSLTDEPGVSTVVEAPRAAFCIVEGVVVAGAVEAPAEPIQNVLVIGLFAGRTTRDGYFRTAVAPGERTLNVVEPAGTSVGSKKVTCDPNSQPVISGVPIIVITPPTAGAPDLDLVDPMQNTTRLPEGTTTYLVTGTASTRAVELVVRNNRSADASFRNTVPVQLDGSWAQTVIIGAGQNTLIATATDAFGRRSVSFAVLDVPGPPQGLKITLTWTTDDTDVDLHVRIPGDEEIDFTNKEAGGGVLDVDDTNGRGPENVTFLDPPAGRYTFWVVYFSGSVPTPVTILVVVQGRPVGLFTRTLTTEKEVFDVGSIVMPEGSIQQ